jgi:hypothetical protein
VLLKGEGVEGSLNGLDRLTIAWGIWLVFITLFHESGVLITQLGEVFTNLGLYFLFRIFLRDIQDIRIYFKVICVLLLPLAALMVIEKLMAKNYISLAFGGTGGLTCAAVIFGLLARFPIPSRPARLVRPAYR